MPGWMLLAVAFYPLAFWVLGALLLTTRLDRFSAFASGLIVFLLLWLGVLPRDLSWLSIEPRFAVPLTAYLAGLVVCAIFMAWTYQRR